MPFITTPEYYGRVEDRAEGRTEGRAEAFAESIETILEVRFPAAASQLMSEIRQIGDHEQLKKILRAAATAATPDELREACAARANRERPE